MQKVLTAEEMREVDRLTTEKYGIPSLLLMENAAHGAARAIAEKCGGSVQDKTVLVLCGKGNNGGDGAALARILWTMGADVEVCLFGKVEETKGDARTNFEILRRISDQEGFELTQTDLAFEEINSLEEWFEYDSLNFHTDDPDIVVDALFGTGLTRPLKDLYEQAAAFIHAFKIDDGEPPDTLVVSLDLPSGLNADNSEIIGTNASSHLTVTFTAPKLANVCPPASNFNGELRIVNIGTPCELVEKSPSQIFVTEREDARKWLDLTRFVSSSYKNRRGHALIIGGAKNYAGAAVMCGNAAIVSGAGLATIAAPESVHSAIAARVLPEVMTRAVSETKNGAISEKAFDEIKDFIDGSIDAVALGSGLSSSDASTKKFVRKFVEKRTKPLILDADALNILAPFKIEGSELLPLILTPHMGEFARLLGVDKESIKDRVKAVRDFARKHAVILVLKGERSLIAAPDGRVVINPTGNSGLGKAGNGDTLTGIIAGFVAQAVQMKIDIFETVVAAVYLAGLAGDIAAEKYGKRSMLASDVRECLAEAFREVEERL